MWLCFPLQTHLPPPLAHPALDRPVFRLLLKPTNLRAFALTTPSAQDTLSPESPWLPQFIQSLLRAGFLTLRLKQPTHPHHAIPVLFCIFLHVFSSLPVYYPYSYLSLYCLSPPRK